MAYQDIVGVWTIGYGETKNVTKGMTITQAQADDMVQKRYDEFEASVKSALKVPLTPNQLGALTCFVYNVGVNAFNKSTLLKLINSKAKPENIKVQFLRWNKAGGKVVNGLTKRRQAELELFFKS